MMKTNLNRIRKLELQKEDKAAPTLDPVKYARMEAHLDAQPDCVKVVGPDYRLMEMNQAGLEMIGARSIEQVRGLSVLEIVDPLYHEEFKKAIDDAYRGSVTEVEFMITGLNGIKSRMNQRAAPIFSTYEKDRVVEIVCGTRDITALHNDYVELIEAKYLAEEANRVKTNFLATMSHEFRTPLNAILGFSEIIKNHSLGKLQNSKYQEYIGDIHDSGRHLLDLVDDVLDISEIEADKRVILKESVNLEEIILHCINSLNILAEKKDIIVATNISGTMPAVYADKRSIKQILINLLSNAIKFSPEDSKVSISLHEEKGFAKILISDNGIGISKEAIKDITEPFFREQSDAEISAPGTGLGLSIVKSLLDAHDGTLHFESQLGKGTTVDVKIPVNSE